MVKMILFVCSYCKDYNVLNKDREGFEPLQYETESLTEVMEHVKLDHKVYTEYREEE